jgi:hypothetical protein
MTFRIRMTTQLRVVSIILILLSLIGILWFLAEFSHFVIYPLFQHPSLAG